MRCKRAPHAHIHSGGSHANSVMDWKTPMSNSCKRRRKSRNVSGIAATVFPTQYNVAHTITLILNTCGTFDLSDLEVGATCILCKTHSPCTSCMPKVTPVWLRFLTLTANAQFTRCTPASLALRLATYMYDMHASPAEAHASWKPFCYFFASHT